MCGRFTQASPARLLGALIDGAQTPARPRYNVAPSQDVLAVRETEHGREPAYLKWGLIPSWTDNPGAGLQPINARSETADTKPTFRDAVRHRRCIVPAEGFYEWRRDGKNKQAFFVHRKDGKPILMAAVWERWRPQDATPIETFAILTTSANETLKGIHDRMPVLLQQQSVDLWLDPKITSTTSLVPLYIPCPASEIVAEPVSSWVNDVKHDDPQCMEVERAAARTGSLFD